MVNKTFASAGILALLFGLTACDDDGGGEVTSNDNGTEEQADDNGTEDEQTPEEEDAEAAEEADTGSADERPTFGDTYTYDDGLAVSMSQPEEFSAGETAAGAEGFDTFVQMEVTLENATGADFDPNLTHISASSGGEEASAVFDSTQGLEGPPTTTLLDGQSTTYTIGFGVADADDLTVEFSSNDFENPRENVIFVSE